jgi:hypothetical protein
VGDILGGAFGVIKWNPKTVLVPSAIVATISGVLLAIITFFMERAMLAQVNMPVAGEPLTSQQLKTFLGPILAFAGVFFAATVIFAIVTSAILTGILTVAVGQGVLGRKETLGGAVLAAVSRIGPLLATMVLSGLIIIVGWMAAIGLSVGLALLLAKVAHLVAIGIFVGVLCGLTATVFAVIVGIRWSLAIPVVILERRGPLASLGRSWQLVRGSAWRVFGITLLASLIAGLISVAIKMPFEFMGGASTLGGTQLHPTITATLTSGVGGIIASALTTPLTAAVSVLLYADLRMRKEGMAATLQAAAAATGQPGSGSTGGQQASPW